jgi:hypothetical protein
LNKKNQNSILFLTTLGVYIGLLMVGSTPGVVVQQGAMTRNFEISDEIEVNDDLDRDPNGCDAVLAAAEERSRVHKIGRPEALNEYASILGDIASLLVRYEPYNRPTYKESGNDPFAFHLGNPRPKLHPKSARIELNNEYDRLAQLIPGEESKKQPVFLLTYEMASDAGRLVASIDRFDEYDAFRLFVSLSAALEYARCGASQPAIASILARTTIVHRESQVLIVTRLPRSGLDPLSATDA